MFLTTLPNNFLDSCVRILDNLPLVVPVRRLEQEAPPAYQQGVYIGVKGQYAGVRNFINFP